MQTEILVAVIAATASFVVAIVTLIANWSHQTQLKQHEHKLIQLRDDLAFRASERSARLDYEYDARKRLYQQCGPLLFQLFEASERALFRIENLAEAARNGNLDPGSDSWLSRGYYYQSTWHRLLVPFAYLRSLQRRLTQIDLSLVPAMHLQYMLVKALRDTFGADFELASLSRPKLRYDPHAKEGPARRGSEPQVYRQQGVPRGILDNAIDSLLLEDGECPRVITYAEFEDRYRQESTDLRRRFDRIEYFLRGFHPHEHPVQWRIFMAQAYLYTMLLESRHSEGLPTIDKLLALRGAIDRSALKWKPGGGAEDVAAADPDDVLEVAEAYFFKRVVPDLRRTFGSRIGRAEDSTGARKNTEASEVARHAVKTAR